MKYFEVLTKPTTIYTVDKICKISTYIQDREYKKIENEEGNWDGVAVAHTYV